MGDGVRIEGDELDKGSLIPGVYSFEFSSGTPRLVPILY